MARTGVRIPITADGSGVSTGVREAERALDRLNKSASRSFSGLKLGALAAGAAVGGVLVASLRTGINELIEAEKVSAQTAAAIKSTGGAAGVTTKQIQEMASKLQALTGKEDDAIQGAANLALAFTNVRNRGEGLNAIFDRTLAAVVDISARTGKDLDPVMRALAKAVNDPEKALTGLTRVGVTFTDQQQKQIRALTESGRTLQAQKLVLAEVEQRFKGAGEAAGNTMAGKLERLKRAWESVSESMARAFMPAMERIADALLGNQAKLQKFADKVGVFIEAIVKGDWEQAGETIVRGLSRGMGAALMRVPGGGAIARLLGFEGAEPPRDLVINVLYGGGLASNQRDQPTRRDDSNARRMNPRFKASGGYVDGPEGAGDIVPTMLTPGEVVLNQRQQRILGPDRIREVLARTGGVMGGFRFASGGVAEDSFSGSGGVKSNVLNFYRQLVEAVPGGQYLMSGYRAGSRIAGSGRISLHASGMAVDIGSRSIRNAGSSSVVAPDLDKIAYMARKALGHPLQVGGTTSNGLGEVLWRTMQGGNHYDHVHIGLKTGGTPTVPGASGGDHDHDHPPARRSSTTGVVTSPMVGGSGPVFPGFGRRGAAYAERDPDALIEWRPGVSSTRGATAQVGREYVGADGKTYFTTTPIINEGAPGLIVDPSLGQDPASLVPSLDQADLIRARTNHLMTQWGMTATGSGDIGTGGGTALAAAFPGGRTVTLTVGATSLVSAVASAAGDQGYSSPAVVPAGV